MRVNRAKLLQYSLFVGLGILKLLYVQLRMDLLHNLGLFTLANVPLLLIVFLPALLFRRPWSIWAGILANALLSILLFADIVYFRYFFDLLPLKALHLMNHVGHVSESVKELICSADFFLFVDIPLWIICACIKKSPKEKTLHNKSITLRQSMGLLAVLLVVSVCYYQILSVVDNGQRVAAYGGALNYHIYDIVHQFGDNDERDYTAVYKEIVERNEEKGKEFYGVARDRHLIVIQVEAMQDFIINRTIHNQEITPFLNKLIRTDTLYFDRYYQMLGKGNTADAEFVSLNSLYASNSSPSFVEYSGKRFYALPNVLRERGYHTVAFHGHLPWYWNRAAMYPQLGFEKFMNSNNLEMDEIINLGLSDASLYKQIVEYIKDQNSPTFSFIVTLSSHHPYRLQQSTFDVGSLHQNTLFGNYVSVMNYVDKTIEGFLASLKDEGLYENSMVVIYGDHAGLSATDPQVKKRVSAYLGCQYDYDEMLNIPLIIHVPGLGKTDTLHITGGQVDFFPTILNLMGIEQNTSYVLLGQDLLNTNEGFTASQTYMLKGSFIDDEKVYEMSRDGIFEHGRAWDVRTGEPVDVEQCRTGYERARLEIEFSHWLLENDMVGKRIE